MADPKLTKAQRAFLSGFNHYGTRHAGWGQGGAALSCVRAGLCLRYTNMNTFCREYSLTDKGRAALEGAGRADPS